VQRTDTDRTPCAGITETRRIKHSRGCLVSEVGVENLQLSDPAGVRDGTPLPAFGGKGRNYPGYFPVGDVVALRDLLHRAETDTHRGLMTTVATNTVHDTDEEIILRKRLCVGERVILYASGCFKHDGTWHRYRETISKIAIDTEAFRQALLDLGFDPVSYTTEDFVTADDDPEAGDIAYMVARKPS